jgi:ribosomal protein S18 acetylase RimI-like enzyme
VSSIKISVRSASVEDAEDFANLILLSALSLFSELLGKEAKPIVKYLFYRSKNLFSFQHTYVAKVENKNIGIILSYDWNARVRESIRTGILLYKYNSASFIKKFNSWISLYSIGKISREEYYISNLAVHPEYRRLGIGSKLVSKAESEAKECKLRKVALDVESSNVGAINFYRRINYRISNRFSVKLDNQTFHFYRMCKEL